MNRNDQRVHQFKVMLARHPRINAMWPAYHKAHSWPTTWEEVTEEQLNEAIAWIERLSDNPSLFRELDAALNLPEEES